MPDPIPPVSRNRSLFARLRRPACLAVALLIALSAWRMWSGRGDVTTVDAGRAAADSASARAALTVTVARLRADSWPLELTANGSVEAWQEVIVGSEVSGLRLVEVTVDVGDRVRSGQLLARLDADTVRAELAQARAAFVEAEAMLAEARANAQRAGTLGRGGVLSAQQLEHYRTAEHTAHARVEVQRARRQAAELRLAFIRIVAPVDGVVSARPAVPGSIAQPGAELFRLIRDGRLEWRAELPDTRLARIEVGQRVLLAVTEGVSVEGRVRAVAPTVDVHTRMGLVYVDLPKTESVRAGSFARGRIVLEETEAWTLPQTAIVLRDGFSYVFRLTQDDRVVQEKVWTGRRIGERVEITGGLEPDTPVVAAGGGFLADGDFVRIAEAQESPDAAPMSGEAP